VTPTQEARYLVFHDREVSACLKVSKALRLRLWGRGSPPLTYWQQLVLVISTPQAADRVVHALRQRQGKPPALVVAWGLPECHVAEILAEGIPVVDGTVVEDPTEALGALAGEWDAARFDQEQAVALTLAEMEAHLEGEGVGEGQVA
jgi:hypothetical protein